MRLYNPAKFTRDYKIEKFLGDGSHSTVMQCASKKNESKWAVKILEKRLLKPQLREAYFHEINIMRNLEHPNIISVHEFFQDDERIYIVMPICKGGTLFTACNARKKDKSGRGRWTE